MELERILKVLMSDPCPFHFTKKETQVHCGRDLFKVVIIVVWPSFVKKTNDNMG